MENNNASQKDATQKIKSSMDRLEALRTTELQNTVNLLQQKQQHLRLERQRLAAKYGDQYPDVQQIDARLRFEEERTKTVQTEAERSAINTEPYKVTSWRVNGMVLDKAGKGLPDITVYLENEQQQIPAGAPYACSNAQGYYVITFEKELVDRVKDKLYLVAKVKDVQKPFVMPDALEARAGTIDYRDIVFTNKACDAPVTGDKKSP